jgi:archaemetzincin
MNSQERRIGVVSFGEVPELALKIIAANISAYYKLTADILPQQENPEYALDERRLQYNAATIIKEFETMHFSGYEKVIGVLNQDLFVPIFTHVYGEAKQGGNFALVSLFRLNKNPDGSSPSSSLFYERTAKVALHELGHLFNLFHCEEKQCLMHYSGGLEDLDASPFYLCRYCSTYLRNDSSFQRSGIRD